MFVFTFKIYEAIIANTTLKILGKREDFMRQFASIGKLLIKRAVGLQRNFKEIEYEVVSKLDEQASGCFACQNYSLKAVFAKRLESDQYQNACSVCENCPRRVFKEEKVEKVTYINEKNRYAGETGHYISTLKTNAIKLLLVLHMMSPNRWGHIMELPMSKLKSILGCDRKTVCSNLEKLKQYGYIAYINNRGILNVVLEGYENYFKSAKDGGRGFLTLSSALVEELLAIKDLTTLRIFLQQLVETDNQGHIEQKIVVKTYEELLRGLPEYCKPNHVKKHLAENKDNQIFEIQVEEKVSFKLNPEYDAKKVKEKLIEESREDLIFYVNQLNEKFEKINKGELRPDARLPKIFYTKQNVQEYVPFVIRMKVFEDLAKMCWQFSIYNIIDTLNYVYVNYTLEHKIIENLAALVRALLPEVEELNNLSGLAA